MKVTTILGARPQFVKAGPVSLALSSRGHREIVLHTGQHYDDAMSKAFFDDLGLPEVALNLGVGSGSHGAQTASMIVGLEQALLADRPDWVVIYGDTNSTVAGALVAAKLRIPLAHVEAGLRSFNRRMPEEINRVVADSLADVLLAPTTTAVGNLLAEGVHADDVFLTGDVMFDAALQYGAQAEMRSTILANIGMSARQYILVTIHRAENTETLDQLRIILEGLQEVAEQLPVVFPMHPRTKALIDRSPELDALSKHLRVLPPVGYFDMISLERSAAVVATDSGGVQKEALFHGTPCVTLRTETEWLETVESGWNRLCPPVSASQLAKTILTARGSRGRDITAYGTGQAAEQIVDVLERRMGGPYRRANGREQSS